MRVELPSARAVRDLGVFSSTSPAGRPRTALSRAPRARTVHLGDPVAAALLLNSDSGTSAPSSRAAHRSLQRARQFLLRSSRAHDQHDGLAKPARELATRPRRAVFRTARRLLARRLAAQPGAAARQPRAHARPRPEGASRFPTPTSRGAPTTARRRGRALLSSGEAVACLSLAGSRVDALSPAREGTTVEYAVRAMVRSRMAPPTPSSTSRRRLPTTSSRSSAAARPPCLPAAPRADVARHRLPWRARARGGLGGRSRPGARRASFLNALPASAAWLPEAECTRASTTTTSASGVRRRGRGRRLKRPRRRPRCVARPTGPAVTPLPVLFVGLSFGRRSPDDGAPRRLAYPSSRRCATC